MQNQVKFFQKLLTDPIFIMTTIIIVGLFYYQSDLIYPAVLLAYVLANCLMLIQHEDWAHGYIHPKNKIFGFFLDLFGYLVLYPSANTVSPRLMSKGVHVQEHHVHWKDPTVDATQYAIDNSSFLEFLFPNFKKLGPRFLTKESIIQQTENYRKNLDPISVLIDKHYNLFIIVFHLMMLGVLGLKYYFYFVFFQLWFVNRHKVLFFDLIPHCQYKTREEEKDMPWLFPLAASAAYHNHHHIRPNEINFGPKWVKYFNVQYWFVRAFYRIDTKVTLL
jgi:hypothetical protein